MKTKIDFGRFEREGQPYAFVQWKGTDACLDLRCKCGASGHLDADFTYAAKCAACGQLYELEPYVRLIETTADEYDGCDPHDFGGEDA